MIDPTRNKEKLIEGVHSRTSLLRPESERAVNAFFDVIREGLAKGDKKFIISGFGRFSTSMKRGKRYPVFKASKVWLEELNGRADKDQEETRAPTRGEEQT